MAQDVTHLVETLHNRPLFLGITFEQLVLILYPLFLIPVAYLWINDLRRRRYSAQVPIGCRKLGLKGLSNCADEFANKYANGTNTQERWRVKALFVHPIKSCAAIELDAGSVGIEGFTYDRKFAWAEFMKPTGVKADAPEEDKKAQWIFRTLRQPGYSKLTLIKPEVWVPKSTDKGKDPNLRRVEQEGAMIIRYPNVPTGALAPLDRLMLKWGLLPKEKSFSVPLNPGKERRYPREKVTVWKDQPHWLDMGEHVPHDFKEWLGAENPVSLFRADSESYREVFGNAPREQEVGYQPVIGFQDSYPVNIMNLASVHDVSKKVGETIPKLTVRRFRPNIVIEGPAAYDEDDWKRIQIGAHEFYCACRTTRCRVRSLTMLPTCVLLTTGQLPNVDPDTAVRHPAEPDKTLKSFRCIDEGDPKNACLGMQMVPAGQERCTIGVGDSIEVLERGAHRAM